jgi:hypothetical protein
MEITQTEQDQFHLFSDHDETMNIDVNLHLDDGADGNVNVVLYQKVKSGDDYGFISDDGDVIGVIRVPYSLIKQTINKEYN